MKTLLPKATIIKGWARSDSSNSYIFNISSIEELYEIYELAKKNGKSISFRSSARSYGDNTLNDNSIVVIYNSPQEIFDFDEITGVINLAGSCKLNSLIKFIIPKGWLLNVSPASQYITVSGCISNNVHGKNCYQKGYFGEYVEELIIATPDKGIVKCSLNQNSDYFHSVISGLGFLGMIISAKLKLRRISSVELVTQIINTRSLEEATEHLHNIKDNSDYNIGSFDFTRFNGKPSGKIYSSSFLETNNLSIKQTNPSEFIKLINFILLVNNFPIVDRFIEYFFSIITNSKKYKKKIIYQDYFKMNFLGDLNLPYYNYFFRKGFIEYQVIFDFNKYNNAIKEIESLKRNFDYGSYMSSIKIYRKNLLNFTLGLKIDGYCLTLDIPYENSSKFKKFIKNLNLITLKYEGQIYFGKSPCINREEFKLMYPKYKKLENMKLELDKNFIIHSDLTKRLFLNF